MKHSAGRRRRARPGWKKPEAFLPYPNVVVCPTPEKRFFTKASAKAFIARGPGVKLYTYECVCGRWHLTSKAQ